MGDWYKMSLKDFFRESDRITNVKIVCRDGLVFTHKIIVASVNNFFKDIISIIHDGDEAVLIMPDHDKRKVEMMLKLDWLKGMANNEASPKISSEKLKNEILENNDPGPHLESNLDESSNVTLKEEFAIDETRERRAGKDVLNRGNDYENYFEGKEKEDYKKSILKRLEELESKIGCQPSNPKEEKVFYYLKRQINYEKAKLDLLTGKVKTFAEACRTHEDVKHNTLKRLFIEKENFFGHNMAAKNAFTTIEEQTIIDEFVKRNNGRKYNMELLNIVMLEKMTEIQKVHPERDFSKFASKEGLIKDKRLAYIIAKRFGLTFPKFEAKFECELCSKSYTMKNSLNKHMKDMHFL